MFWGFCSSWGAFCFAVLVVLPLVLCFFSSWCCGWQWSFDAGHCYWCLSIDAPGMLGCFSFFWWLSVGAWGASARLGCSSSSLAWLRWRLSFCALGLLLSLIQLPSAASAHGLCCVLRFRSSSSFFSSFYLFFLFLAFFFFGCLCSLWSPSCFPCLALPGVWPSLVLGLVGPSWPLLVVVLVLSSIVWGSWRWWPCWRWWWWWSAFARLWCMASVCSLAWWWLAFVRLWFWCGWLVVAFARLWCEACICSLAWWMVGVCSPLVLVWLVGGRRFSRLWCEASVCSLAWWWLAFARLWWPRVCSLGRWLASVCLGSVIAAGFVVACHGYAAWDAVLGLAGADSRPSSF